MEGTKLFSVYLIHSLPLEMSAIQTFVGDKMAVVAHLVGPDTIGKTEKNLGLDHDVSAATTDKIDFESFVTLFFYISSSTARVGVPC